MNQERSRNRLHVSMIVVGDEILEGFVQDANVQIAAQSLRSHGLALEHAQVVRDDRCSISDAVSAELDRFRPTLVVVCGGTGSTLDDVTYEALAATLGVDLEVNEKIAKPLRWFLDWQRDAGLEMPSGFVDDMFRIARVPEGSTVFRYKAWLAGVACNLNGGCVQSEGVTIVVLPGVPTHFEALWEHNVVPMFIEGRGAQFHVATVTHDFPETSLNSAFRILRSRYPDVEIGSYPGEPMVVRLKGDRLEVEEAVHLLRKELERLEQDDATGALRKIWSQQIVPWSNESDS